MSDIEQNLRRSAAALPAGGPSTEMMRGLAERAQAEGLVDVAYASVDSPLGPLTVAATEQGVVLLSYPEHPLDSVLERLAAKVSPRIMEAPARLDPIRRELEEYFAGERKAFEQPIDWQLTRGFYEQVLRATAKLPYGQTVTYREMAELAGNPAAVRAAGSGLGSNPIPVIVPCHRVLATGGGLGGYTGGLDRKQQLLALERGELPLG